jgi:hypothetical protein
VNCLFSLCETPCGPRREMYLNLCAVSAQALSCRFFLALQHASRVTALGRGFLTGGSSRLSVPLRRLCSIKTLHRVPRLAARPCESYCTIASRPVHHARLRSTPALDLAPRGVSSGRPSQAKLPWTACLPQSFLADPPLRHSSPGLLKRTSACSFCSCLSTCLLQASKVCYHAQFYLSSSDAVCRNTYPSVTCC